MIVILSRKDYLNLQIVSIFNINVANSLVYFSFLYVFIFEMEFIFLML